MRNGMYLAIIENIEELIDSEGEFVEATDLAMNNLQIAETAACGDLTDSMTATVEELSDLETDLARALAGQLKPHIFIKRWKGNFDRAKLNTLDCYHEKIWDVWCDIRDDGFREE